jgi:hypothetical protein
LSKNLNLKNDFKHICLSAISCADMNMFFYMRLPCSSKNGRALLAAKAGRTAVRAGAKAKAIKEINLEEWTTKRRASTPVKGGAQDPQGNIRDDARATTAMMTTASRQRLQ